MKLYDIRTALKNLVHINKNLTKDRLTILLQAAGWDEQDVKDAVLMWEQHAYEDLGTPNTGADVIIKEDMSPTVNLLESTTTIFANTDISKDVLSKDSKKENVQVEKNENIHKPVETPLIKKEEYFLSPEIAPLPLVLKEESKQEMLKEVATEDKKIEETPPSIFNYISKQTPHEELPHNLPLRPYESSFVTVPLNEYEKRFASHVATHVDTMETHKAILNGSTLPIPVPEIKKVNMPPTPQEIPRYVDKVVEAPLETEDKYLAFIAIILFMLILFILGYMHIMGRI